jgi:bifunctional DNase/RNase
LGQSGHFVNNKTCLLKGLAMARKDKMVTIRDVQLESDPTSGRMVILKEGGGARRHLTMVIGDSEFAAIAKEKGLLASRRPLTHKLYLDIIEKLEAKFLRIEIFDLKDNTYYAKVIFSSKGKEHAVDSRPSDAIALALNQKIPIMVNEQLLRPIVVLRQAGAYKEFVWRVEF